MSENTRTLIYVAVAAVVGLFASATKPGSSVALKESYDERFFPAWKDLGESRSFEVVTYDETLDQVNKFSVAKKGGRWVIPSHNDYPADAAEQLKNIASTMIDLKKLRSKPVGETTADHEQFGVKEPTDQTKAEKNIGKLVTISNEKGDPLARLIVGKKASVDGEQAGAKEQNFYFVRVPGQDAVFVAEIAPTILTTKFADWIEPDLLKLNAFDTAKLTLKDYSIVSLVDETQNLRLQFLPRMDTVVSWNATENAWNLDSMELHKGQVKEATQLADDEELDKTKLDGVKTAIDDLKIVDVVRRDEILAEALKDETKLARDARAQASLQKKGFFVTRANRSQALEILGTNGEISIGMKDGLEYVLRFGNIKSAEKEDETKLNRYLMVTARIDESLLPPPMLEPVEAGPEPEAKKEEEKKSDAAKAEGEAEKKDDSEEKKEDPEEERRSRIRKENKRKQDDYKEKRTKVEARVSELNARFADWFYVISEDVYKKIHLSRSDIVKDRETAKDEGFGVDAFRNLDKAGPKKAK